MSDDTPECPRCAALRGRSVKMHRISIGKTPTAYECASCDYSIMLQPFPEIAPTRPWDLG